MEGRQFAAVAAIAVMDAKICEILKPLF